MGCEEENKRKSEEDDEERGIEERETAQEEDILEEINEYDLATAPNDFEMIRVKDHFPEGKPKERTEEDVAEITPRVRISDIKVQNDKLSRLVEEGTVNNEILQDSIFVFVDKENVGLKPKDLKHHMEHIVMIKLGRMLHENTLNFTKYTK